jgi:hypothetical protein
MSETEKQPAPTILDYEWTDHILSLFGEKEIYDGKPTVDGLRRIAQKILGEIQCSKTKVIQKPTPDNGMATTVKVRVTINGKTFDGCANVTEASAPDIIGQHVVALAETRAEGRALKKALNLRVLTKEEAGLNELDTNNTLKISQTQIDAINRQAVNFNINVDKLLIDKYNKTKDTIHELTCENALEIFEQFSNFANSEVPKEYLND